MTSKPKWIAYAGGVASIATIIGVIIAYLNYVHPTPNPGPSPNITINNTDTNNTPVPAPTKPSLIWTVILNRSYNTLTYNKFTVNDTQGHHFLVVDMSFSNQSSTTQTLSGGVLDLKDGFGNYYTEDQASNPGQSFAVDPGQSIETTTVFVVPNSSCKFELSFSPVSDPVTQWTINSSLCSGAQPHNPWTQVA